MGKVAVIIPAAGAGRRFGGEVRKPFAQIDNRPVFIRTVELFVTRPDVAQVYLTVSPDDFDVVREKYAANLMFMNIKLVKGGAQRYESVRNALGHVEDSVPLVCVHDAVRPCVLSSWIDAVFAEAEKSGAALLAAPLVGTIKRVKGGRVEATIPRDGLYEAQTPQVFRRDLLVRAYADMPADFAPTDDAQVVERLGAPVSLVEADRRNLKITTPGDLAMAAVILKDIARTKPSSGPRSPFEEAQW